MIDSDILDRYREGVRALLSAPKEEQIGTAIPEYQLIILEELLSSARHSIAVVCNEKKMFLWTEKVLKIIKDNSTANFDIKIVVANAGEESILLSLGNVARVLSKGVSGQDNFMTVVVVDGRNCMVVGPAPGDDMVLFVGGDTARTKLCTSFVDDAWSASAASSNTEAE